MLTDAALKALKPKDKVYKVSDRDGMYARVTPTGTAVRFALDAGLWTLDSAPIASASFRSSSGSSHSIQ